MSHSFPRKLTLRLRPYSHVSSRDNVMPSVQRSTSFCTAAAVGTVQVRSLVEPLRKIVARLRGHVLNAKV